MTHTPTPAHQPGMTGGSMSTRRRALLVVEVDLDPVPGWGNHVEDWRAMLQRHLDNTASHYRPAVTAPEATDPTPGEVGLTAEERGVLLEATHFSHRTCEHIAPAVERILAARTADLRAEHAAEVEAWKRATGEIDPEHARASMDDLAAMADAARAEGSIEGQMQHITAEMVRGDQPLAEKEELIADLRARLSHVEAERDAARREERMRAEDHARAWREVAELRATTVERVEALADEWEEEHDRGVAPEDNGRSFGGLAYDLRAALATPPATEGGE